MLYGIDTVDIDMIGSLNIENRNGIEIEE